MIKNIIKKIVPKKIIYKAGDIRGDYFGGYAIKSYSHEGEDMVLNKIFEDQEQGFYVDVGAHHPKRFSNTFFFYKKGWRGINIDAMPGSMKIFKRMRPRDINIEQSISDKEKVLKYHAFDESALNGFSREISEERDKKGDYCIKFTKDIKTTTLAKVLDDNLPINQNIDFLSIDVEGLDFEVLKSNNFNKYLPKIILIEMLGSKLEDIMDDEITRYLKQFDYAVYAKTTNTVVFINNEFYNFKIA